MPNTKNQNEDLLKIYKVLNDRVTSEISESYRIHYVFLLIATALVVTSGTSFGNPYVHIALGLIGILVAFAWGLAVDAQRRWKNWWIQKVAVIEKYLELPEEVRVWQSISEDTAADAQSVGRKMMVMPWGFGILSFASLTFGLFLYCCRLEIYTKKLSQ